MLVNVTKVTSDFELQEAIITCEFMVSKFKCMQFVSYQKRFESLRRAGRQLGQTTLHSRSDPWSGD